MFYYYFEKKTFTHSIVKIWKKRFPLKFYNSTKIKTASVIVLYCCDEINWTLLRLIGRNMACVGQKWQNWENLRRGGQKCDTGTFNGYNWLRFEVLGSKQIFQFFVFLGGAPLKSRKIDQSTYQHILGHFLGSSLGPILFQRRFLTDFVHILLQKNWWKWGYIWVLL